MENDEAWALIRYLWEIEKGKRTEAHIIAFYDHLLKTTGRLKY